ncbi:hypothetical protein [Listeria newyorkensis]|uniref:hypothetical protein n=1 Tax=Listeria newyorkensis TaxID=1497681 RepID=UPI00051D029D|nr:hypothetical protein [Listeria newyorkensis]KGL43568.1 hypothetical protein EP58_07455 [Listeria newyorkensis]
MMDKGVQKEITREKIADITDYYSNDNLSKDEQGHYLEVRDSLGTLALKLDTICKNIDEYSKDELVQVLKEHANAQRAIALKV